MILHSYLGKKLRSRFVAISLLLGAGIFTESLIAILHTINTPFMNIRDLLILMAKESASSLPIIFNFSFLLSWILMKRELEDKKASLPLMINLWDEKKTSQILKNSLFWLSTANIFCLFLLNVYIRNLGPSITDSPFNFIARSKLRSPLAFCINPTTAIRFEPATEPNQFQNVRIFSYHDDGLRKIHASNGQIIDSSLQLKDVTIQHNQQNDHVLIETLRLKIPDQEKNYDSSFWSLNDIFSHLNKREKGQILWRFGLIAQPWILFLLPLKKIEYTPKQSLVHRNELSRYSLIFLFYLIALFFISKRIVF